MKRNSILRIAATVVAAVFVSFGAWQVQANNTTHSLFGIDVSSAQGSINWSNVYAGGARFAYAKATEGTSVTDADYARNIKRGKNNGLQMGAYHFAYPAVTCPSAQANYFWSVAGADIVADGQSISPAVDLEVFTGVGCSEGTYTTWLNDYYTDLRAHSSLFFHAVVAISPCDSCNLTGASLGPWILNENGQNLYTGNPWSVCCTCNPWDPTGSCNSNAWDFWLATSGSISGVNGSCDFDAYNGTLAELKNWQGI